MSEPNLTFVSPYNFILPTDQDKINCFEKNQGRHNWHILIDIEGSDYTMAICRDCALLSGGFRKLKGEQNGDI